MKAPELKQYSVKEFRRISWNEYGMALDRLYKKVDVYLKKGHIIPDAVVPILRGGAIPGTYLAYRLKLLTILPVQYKYLDIKGKSELRKLSDIDKRKLDGMKKPVFLLVENNHCFGGTAQVAVNDLKKEFPGCKIIYAAAHADYTHQKLKGVDAQFWGRLTNETKALSPKEAKRKGLPNFVFVFPWERFDEELSAVNSKKYIYQDLGHAERLSKPT